VSRIIELLVAEGEVPASALEWAICPQCHGEGSSSLYLGAYTGSEWAEMDEDWRDDYMAGAFDRTCETCTGAGKVREIRESWLESHPEVVAQIDEWYEDEAMAAAERRAGA
jgi:hypothetical protein